MQTIRACLFKILAGLLILGLVLTGSGCSTKETAAPQVSSPTLSIERKVHTETVRDEKDGTVLLTLKMTYPQIKNPENNAGISKINEYYGKQYDEFRNRVMLDGLRMARGDKEAARNSGFEFRPHAYERDMEMDYNANNLLSVVNLQYENTGGAHPNSCWLSDTFDVTTGKKLSLADILGGSREEALEKVYQTVLEQIKKTEGTEEFVYQDNYPENVRNSFSENDFVLTSNSLMVYYQPYAIAPYAAGIPKFELPYSQMKSPALKIPAILQNSLERDLYEQVGRLIDNNKEAYFEIFGLSMLRMDIPENRAENEVLFPVIDNRFRSYKEMEQFVRGTYIQAEADSLLSSGKYRNVDGQLLGDVSKDAGTGYYVNWDDYSYVLENTSENSATPQIMTTDDSPAGKKSIMITGKLKKEKGVWLLEKMLF